MRCGSSTRWRGPRRIRPAYGSAADREHYDRAVQAGVIPADVQVYSQNLDLKGAIAHRQSGKEVAIIDDTELMAAYATPGWSPYGARLFGIGPVKDATRYLVSDEVNGLEQIDLDGNDYPAP